MTEFTTNHSLDPTLILDFHQPRLDELQQRWDKALPEVAGRFGLAEHEATPAKLQEASFQTWIETREQAPDKPIVIGVAGPGACGKGTVTAYLERVLNYPKVINTTTRAPRDYETNGEDYHFLSPEEFERQKTNGAFLTNTERPNRGSYAISRQEIEAKLADHANGCIIEENPATLLDALEATQRSGGGQALTSLLYLLPPEPMVDTLAQRLYQRSSLNPDERRLTTDDIESTLGDRQIDEFISLCAVAEYPDVNVIFMVNDNLEQTYRKIDVLFGTLPTENYE